MTTSTAPEQDTIQSRLPDPTKQFPEMAALSGAVHNALRKGPVPQTTINLMMLRAGQIVGSTYHTVQVTNNLRKLEEAERRITAVATWQDAPYFTEAERAALALVEAVLQPSAHGERVSDELYARVSEHYDAKGLATLAMVIGQVNFYVPLAVIGKPLPGKSPTQQWTPAE